MTAADQPGLLIEAELTVDLPQSRIRLHSEGDTLYVEAPSFAALREIRTTVRSEAVDWLRQQGLDSPLRIETPVIVRVEGVPVARYTPSEPAGSPSERAGWLAKRLTISPFRVDLTGLLQAAWRRRRSDN